MLFGRLTDAGPMNHVLDRVEIPPLAEAVAIFGVVLPTEKY